jgi:hypothetical protein
MIEHMFVPPPQVKVSNEALKSLEGELAELCGMANAINGRMVELMADALDRNLWAGWGIHSPEHWFGWKTSMAPASVRGVVALARRYRELPLTTAALSDGSLSLAQAALIARHVPASYETSVMEFAPQATVSQLQRTLPKVAFDPDPEPAPEATGAPEASTGNAMATDDPPGNEPTDSGANGAGSDSNSDSGSDSGSDTGTNPTGPKRTRLIEERRDWAMGQNEDGSWWFNGHLPADEGALLHHAVKTARDDLFNQASAGLPEGATPPRVSLVDGLLAMAETSLAAGQVRFPSSDRYRIYAHLEASPNSGGSNVLSFHLGPVLPEHLRLLHTCDAKLCPVLERDGTPINLGRDQRIVPRRIRRLIEHRDGGCAVPGCGRRFGLDIHHITHWEHGGPTDTANLVTLCRGHHRLHHLGGLQIWGNADLRHQPEGLCFADQWGYPLRPTGTPKPPDLTSGHVAAAAGTSTGINTGPYRHPFGERIDAANIHFRQDPNWVAPQYQSGEPSPPEPLDPELDPASEQVPDPKNPPGTARSWPSASSDDRTRSGEDPAQTTDPTRAGPEAA